MPNPYAKSQSMVPTVTAAAAPKRARFAGSWQLWSLILLLVAAFGLRVMRLEVQSIWVDEGFSVDFASRTAADMTAMWKARGGVGVIDNAGARQAANDPLAIAVDIHPPLYYFALHEWLPWAGRGEYAVRFPSVIAGLLLVLVLFKLGQALAGPALGLVAAGVGAVAPYDVAYSQEARMYAQVALFAALSLYFTWRILRSQLRLGRPGSLWPWVGLVVSGGLALYTHYSAVLAILAENAMVAGVALWLLRQGNGKGFRRLVVPWAASQLIEALLFVPWLRTTIGQIAQYDQNLWTPNWRVELNDTFRAFDVGLWVPISPAERLLYGLTGLLVLGLLVATLARRWPLPGWHSGRALVFGVAALGLETAAALVALQIRPEFHPRYLMVLSTPFYLLWGVALLALWRRLRAAGGLASLALLAASLWGLYGYQFDPTYAKDDTRTLASYIAGRATAADVIFLDAPEPLDYYYHGPAAMDYLPGTDPRLPAIMTRYAAGKRRIFYVQWFLSTSDPEQRVPFLLKKYGQLVNEHTFRGYREWEYDVPAATTFSLGQQRPVPAVNYGGRLQLIAAGFSSSLNGQAALRPDLGRPVVPSGNRLMLGLTWKLLRPVTHNYKATAYLTDAAGHFAGQVDLLLYRGQATTVHWRPGDSATNYYALQTVGGLMPGTYALKIAVYPEGKQDRVNVLNAAGTPSGDTATVAAIQVLPPAGPVSLASLGISHPLSQELIRGVQMDGFDLPKTTLLQGDPLPLTLFWGISAVPAPGATTTISLQPKQGGSSWKWSRQPGFGSASWRPGWVLRDWYEPSLPLHIQPGAYQLSAGLNGHQVPLATVQVQARQRSFAMPHPRHPVTAQIGPGIELLGYDLAQASYQPGQTVQLTLYWRCTAAMAESYTAFAHLLDGTRHVTSQQDTVPVQGTLPTNAWVPNQIVTDRYTLPLPSATSAGTYQLEVGFYRASTGIRLAAQSGQLKVIDDGILIGSLRVG